MAGCKKGEMKEENQEVDKFFYSKLPKTNQKVSEEEEKKIQKGIENWAKQFCWRIVLLGNKIKN